MATDDLKIRITAEDLASPQLAGLVGKIREAITNMDQLERRWGSDAAQRYLANLQNSLQAAIKTIVDLKSSQANVDKQIAEIVGSAAKAGGAFADFGQKAEESLFKIEGGLRHTVAFFDESMRHQRGAMISTVGAFLRDTNLMKLAIENATNPWTLFATAAIAAGAAAVYPIEQAYQRMQAIRETQTAALVHGGASAGSQAQATAEVDYLQSTYKEYEGTVREIEEQLNRLPSAAQNARKAFADLGEGMSGLSHEDIGKVMKELTDEARKGPDALEKYVEEFYQLDGVLQSNGKTVAENVAAASGWTEKIRVLLGAIKELRGEVNQAGVAGKVAANSFWEDVTAIEGMADTAPIAGEALGKVMDNIERGAQPLKNLKTAGDQTTQMMKEQNEAVKALMGPVTNLESLFQQLALVEGAVATNTGEAGARAREALENIQARIERAPADEGEQLRHQQVMDDISAEARARHADQQAQVDAARRRVQEMEKLGVDKLVTAGVDPEVAATQVQQFEDVRKAKQDLAEEEKKLSDQSTAYQIGKMREVVAEDARGTQQRIAAQQQIIAMTRKEVDEGRKSILDLQNEEIRLASLKRELANKSYQEARDQAQNEVELAKGKVDQIIAAYQKLSQVAVATGQAPAVQAQIAREQTRALESAQSTAFTQMTEFNSSAERLDAMRIAAMKANLASWVAVHAMTKDQAIQKEEQYTSQLMAEEERRLENELQINGETNEQKIRLYDNLAQLYEKDAQNQQQAAERATAAIEAENNKKLKSFTTMFDAIGTASEKLLEAGIMRTQTRAQALQQFGSSILRAGLGEVGHLGSQWAGKGLAGLLGVDTKGMEDTGIGAVLGRKLGDMLGITKDESGPQQIMKGAADKMEKAAEMQEKAAQLQSDAIKNMTEAGRALNQGADKLGVGSGYSRGGGVSFSGEERFTTTVAMNTQALQELRAMLAMASRSLPPGYSVEAFSGVRPGATVAGTGGISQHALGDAVDVRIVGPAGAVPGSMGVDTTGMYQQLAVAMYKAQQQLYPQLSGQLASGTQFAKQDAGHFDLGGDRGAQGSLASLAQSTQLVTSAQQSEAATINSSSSAVTQNTTDTNQAAAAVTQLGNSARTATSAVGSSGAGGTGGAGLVGGFQQLTGALGSTVPALRIFSSVLGTVKSVFSAVGSIGSGVGGIFNMFSGAGGIGSLFGLLAFEGGGIVPSAQGGMVSSGGLSILHPREMVLPAHISTGLQNMIQTGRNDIGSNSFTYNANVTGYHPYATRSNFEAMLRTHGSAMQSWVENSMRNGWSPVR